MDDLLKQLVELMKQLEAKDPELYKKFVDLIRNISAELRKRFGKFAFGDWIDPFRGGKKP